MGRQRDGQDKSAETRERHDAAPDEQLVRQRTARAVVPVFGVKQGTDALDVFGEEDE